MAFPASPYARAVVAIALALGGAVRAWAAEQSESSGETERSVSSYGSLAWISADELDLVGELATDLPWELTPAAELYLGLWTQTAITESLDEFTFDVREINYSAEIGVRRRLAAGPTLLFLAGQDGKALVDTDGSAFVRYVAAGAESGIRPGRGLYWNGAVGGVVDDHGVSADALARGVLRWDVHGSGTAWDGVGIDLEVDGLFDGSSYDADIEIGPHYAFDFSGDDRLTLFAHYLHSENPLGLGVSGVLAGFEYADGPAGRGSRLEAPVVQGRVAAGAGGDRTAGRLALNFEFPPFCEVGWLAAEFDVNALGGDDTDELYYFYRLGYEWEMWGMVTGAYFYHRSNHQLSQASPEVTSVNVLDFGVETPTWRGAVNQLDRSRWGRLDWIAHGGALLSSSFGEDRRWWIRGGARWMMPLGAGRFVPLIEAEIEEGDAGRYTVGAGVAGPWGTVLEVKYLEDDQFFGDDSSAFLAVAERRF